MKRTALSFLGFAVICSMISAASTAHASVPLLRCQKQIYGAALETLMKINAETDGITILLERIEGIEGTQRSYIAHLTVTDSSRVQRFDSYKVVLSDMESCQIKSATLLID
jgi:hypothetical protein